MAGDFGATAPIKLVIWDLDETFWRGTLSEEGIELIGRHVEIVRTLVDRGIMSSIVSKNDIEPVRKVLIEAGIWDLFIFPKIAWTAKGTLVADIVEQANLRPENVLFIDDNAINVEEARFRFPAMMVAYPQDVIPVLLDLPEAVGKDDSGHSRLKQYKQLEQKVADQQQNPLSNVDFLRQSDIRLRFEFDVDSHMERIVELINRSNQLNYTKVRLEDKEAIAEFHDQLKRHDIFAAGIFASDRYGSHGLIGFYMQRKNERENRLLHYVWSCRMMNAGLEQYVYESLGRPEIKIVEPVSNPIVVFEKVDWIAEMQDTNACYEKNAPHLLLIGSCDLAAVASYCSSDRIEFVNGIKNGVMTRFDDFGFILGDPQTIAQSQALAKMPAWNSDEYKSFHTNLATSDLLIVSLSAAMKGVHCLTKDGVVLRVHPEGLGFIIDFNPKADFLRDICFYDHTIEQKIHFLQLSLNLIDATAPEGSRKYLLGANTRASSTTALSAEDRNLLTSYNSACQSFCKVVPGWNFVSIDEVVAQKKLIDDRHYSRMGYLDIANYINADLNSDFQYKPSAGSTPDFVRSSYDLVDLIRSGRRISRLTMVGGSRMRGPLSYLKQAIKISPLSGILRKFKY